MPSYWKPIFIKYRSYHKNLSFMSGERYQQCFSLLLLIYLDFYFNGSGKLRQRKLFFSAFNQIGWLYMLVQISAVWSECFGALVALNSDMKRVLLLLIFAVNNVAVTSYIFETPEVARQGKNLLFSCLFFFVKRLHDWQLLCMSNLSTYSKSRKL